jgi:hypothetical protein
MADKVAADELARVLNLEGETVTMAGESLTVKPFRLKQFVGVLRCVGELFDNGMSVVSRPVANPECQSCEGTGDVKGSPCACLTKKDFREFNFGKMLLSGGDSVIEILSIATGKDSEWLGNLDLAESTELASTVWSVNKDFFSLNQGALKEALGPLGELATAKIASLGLGQSSNSLAPDTDQQTSQSTPSRRSKTSARP